MAIRGVESDRAGDEVPLAANEISFLLCIEANRLEPQALLLCESLRTFGGRYRNASIVAVSPRPALAVGRETRARLEALGVTYVVEPLNETGSPYGSINRIVAGAWAEKVLPHSYLVLLDTDMLLVAEPRFARADAGVRPVDLKGSASSGSDDPLDAYWAQLCAFGGLDLSALPRLQTTIDGVSIRASYNGGFTVVRRDLGILEQTREVFFASRAANLRPWEGAGLDIFASTGSVGREASEWWGSSQAALAVGIWGRTSDVQVYDPRYNIPLHLLVDPARTWFLGAGLDPILLHYHYLAEKPFQTQLLQALHRIGCSSDVRVWIEDRLRFFANS